MGYRFTVEDEDLLESYRDLAERAIDGEADFEAEWDYDENASINSKALCIDALPDHLNRAKFGTYNPHEARLLADAIDLQLCTNAEVREHSRFEQLVDLVDWLRYWARHGMPVRSG